MTGSNAPRTRGSQELPAFLSKPAGRGVGAIKGAVVALAWLAGALVAQAAGWVGGNDDGRTWIFQFLQLFTFLVVLGILYDLRTLRSVGRGWRTLRLLAGIQTQTGLLAYIAYHRRGRRPGAADRQWDNR